MATSSDARGWRHFQWVDDNGGRPKHLENLSGGETMLQRSLISTNCRNKISKPVSLVGFWELSYFFLGTRCFFKLEGNLQPNKLLPSFSLAAQKRISSQSTGFSLPATNSHSQPLCLRLSAGQPGFLPSKDLPAAAAAAAEKENHKSPERKVCHVVAMATANSFLQSLLENLWHDGTRRGSCLKNPFAAPLSPPTSTATTFHARHISRAADRMPH